MLQVENITPGHLEFILASDLEYIFEHYPGSKLLYQAAAAKGHRLAQFNLGLWYLEGNRPGTQKDLVTARALFQASADQGVGMSMYSLGTLYEQGEAGLPKDEAAAFKLYERAAKEGNEWPEDGFRRVCLKLSHMYAEGKGTPKDLYKAAEWMAKYKKETKLSPDIQLLLSILRVLSHRGPKPSWTQGLGAKRQENADDKWRKMCHYIDSCPGGDPTTYKKWEIMMRNCGYVPSNPKIKNPKKKNRKCNFPEFMELCGGSFKDLATYEIQDLPVPPAKCEHCNVEESDEVKLIFCERCRERYCSKECQEKDWKVHKRVCDMVALFI